MRLYVGLDDTDTLGGTGDGVVGALAAVGLRGAGTDGWLTLWDGLRHLDGVVSVDRLLAEGLDRVEDEKGRGLAPTAVVDTRGRVRPALRDGRRVLLVRRVPGVGWAAIKPEHGRLA